MRRRQLKRGRNSKRTAAANRFDRKINRFKTAIERKTHHPDVNKLLPFLNERIAFKMPSDIAYLDQVLDYITERMLDLGIIGPGDSEVLVALDEAIVNAIKHGNKSDPRKAVHIVAEMNAGGARFTVRDEGCGFAQRDVPDPTEPARLQTEWPRLAIDQAYNG